MLKIRDRANSMSGREFNEMVEKIDKSFIK
jgi:hypothetical protein